MSAFSIDKLNFLCYNMFTIKYQIYKKELNNENLETWC